ncbi:DUF1684 domain-containing protein [Aureimonas psammosilenae]|uniref:DUF1684 domain-containing protein n=1 Tax=Aureimonas psammosilenae TaxID=2495496 RepID=UPI001260A85B|nr:DUF1684 domain-containing protein [Aureimonas psammosilenae]
MSDAAAEFEAWKARRLAALTAPDGWLTIIGRYPLTNGTATVGSAEDNDIVLSTGPAHVGSLTQDAGGVTYRPADGEAEQKLVLDKSNPPRFTSGDLLLEVTTLNGENALRVRHTASQAPKDLAPLTYFPFDPFWRIVAEWLPFAEPQRLTVDTSKAVRTEVSATHKAVFEHGGQRFELIATHGTPDRPQFVIRDATAGAETYPAARFVFGEDVTDTTLVLDFNRAVNPPCSFTDFAVCPLPPPQNVLPIRVEAGEKRAAH